MRHFFLYQFNHFLNFHYLYICKKIKMIAIGKYNTLTILRDTKVGIFLGNPTEDPEGIHDILLPNKYLLKLSIYFN